MIYTGNIIADMWLAEFERQERIKNDRSDEVSVESS